MVGGSSEYSAGAVRALAPWALPAAAGFCAASLEGGCAGCGPEGVLAVLSVCWIVCGSGGLLPRARA